MYNKLFTKILDSSIWLESDTTRIVWLTCIAAMDQDGFVQFASVANLAHRANVPLEAATRAVEVLESPDSNSSDPDNEGRRLERVPGGWLVLNALKYRDLVTRIASREQVRKRVERHRARKRSGNAATQNSNEPSRNGNAHVTQSEADAEAHSETRSDQKQISRSSEPLRPRPKTFGRITLHRWQLEELITTLGPHAAGFALDEWVEGLSATADRQQKTLHRDDVWPWVQAELKAECQRRGLASATASAPGKLSPRLQRIAQMERELGGEP